MSLEKLFEYTIKGALLIFVLIFLSPFILGYGIAIFLQKIYNSVKSFIFPEKKRYASYSFEEDSETADLEKEEKIEEIEEEPEEEEIEILRKEFTLNRKIYIERNLKPGQKEALDNKKYYERIKISPYGNSGATYFWVKKRYNESAEHAFFCYLIVKELREYTKKIKLFINNGPDVVVKHNDKVYAFDVETGKNLIKRRKETKLKFLHYKQEHYRSYIFVTNKSLKRKYQNLGIVITRGTFRKVISDIFS